MILCDCKENLARRGAMEEENKDFDAREGKAEQPTREDILAASRNENKNGDEREKQIYKNAIQIAYSIGFILTCVIMLVSSVMGKLSAELMIVYTGMSGTMGLYCGIKFTKRKPLFLACGAVCLFACAVFIVYWILQLCGII